MLSESIVLTLVLASNPETTVAPPAGDEPVCAALPPVPNRIEAQPFTQTANDGSRSWGATATYRLSGGELGEAFMVLDDDGSGEAQLMVDGEIVAHTAIAMDSEGNPVITQWVPDTVTTPPEVIAEMMRVDLPGILAGAIPQEFKCSDWGRKVMKAGRYMVGAALAASAAACCIASQGLACVACAAGAWVGNEAAGEFANGYCD